MKDVRSPTITPGLNDAATLPMLRIGPPKTGRITPGGCFMHHAQTLAPLAFESNDFGKGPVRLALTIAPPHRHRAETFGVLLPEGCCDRIDPLPLPIPLDMPGAFHCADPM